MESRGAKATTMNNGDILDYIESRVIRVPESGCWLWMGKTSRGYGVIETKGLRVYAHRASWELFNNRSPVGLSVCHRCDVPCCVNPHHLFAGTHRQNMDDMVKKGRQQRIVGVDKLFAKLDAEKVIAIRVDPRPHRTIASEYGIASPTVCRIKNRQAWSHV